MSEAERVTGMVEGLVRGFERRMGTKATWVGLPWTAYDSLVLTSRAKIELPIAYTPTDGRRVRIVVGVPWQVGDDSTPVWTVEDPVFAVVRDEFLAGKDPEIRVAAAAGAAACGCGKCGCQ